jgi:hypothetical protein
MSSLFVLSYYIKMSWVIIIDDNWMGSYLYCELSKNT